MSTFTFFLHSQLLLPTPALCRSRLLFGQSRNLIVTANSVIYEMNLPFSQVAKGPTLEPQDGLTILCCFHVPFLKLFTSHCQVYTAYESCAALYPAQGSITWVGLDILYYVAITLAFNLWQHTMSLTYTALGDVLFLFSFQTDTNSKVY